MEMADNCGTTVAVLARIRHSTRWPEDTVNGWEVCRSPRPKLAFEGRTASAILPEIPCGRRKSAVDRPSTRPMRRSSCWITANTRYPPVLELSIQTGIPSSVLSGPTSGPLCPVEAQDKRPRSIPTKIQRIEFILARAGEFRLQGSTKAVLFKIDQWPRSRQHLVVVQIDLEGDDRGLRLDQSPRAGYRFPPSSRRR